MLWFTTGLPPPQSTDFSEEIGFVDDENGTSTVTALSIDVLIVADSDGKVELMLAVISVGPSDSPNRKSAAAPFEEDEMNQVLMMLFDDTRSTIKAPRLLYTMLLLKDTDVPKAVVYAGMVESTEAMQRADVSSRHRGWGNWHSAYCALPMPCT